AHGSVICGREMDFNCGSILAASGEAHVAGEDEFAPDAINAFAQLNGAAERPRRLSIQRGLYERRIVRPAGGCHSGAVRAPGPFGRYLQRQRRPPSESAAMTVVDEDGIRP